MFKSIFSKYLWAFTVILLVCITAILLTVSSHVASESFELQRDTMGISLDSTTTVIDGYLEQRGYEKLYTAFEKGSDLYDFLHYSAEKSRAEFYVFDKVGLLVASTDENYTNGNYSISDTAMNAMKRRDERFSISTVEGFFKDNRMNAYAVGESHGYNYIVLTSVEDYTHVVFSRGIFVVAVTVALWIFLAAMLALYVISRRITDPLVEVIDAAKEYSRGRFEAKISYDGADEVAELSKAINDMADSLKKIDETRNAFLGNVSHDLRTPMTTISGFVDGILDGTIPPEQHEKYLSIVSAEVKRLSRLVNTLLEVSKLQNSEELKMAKFNLSETARTVIISLESKISKKKIDIDFDTGEDDVFVLADKDSIHRVIFNLMDNAVKFTPEKGDVSIKISIFPDGKKRFKAKFVIRNTGEGIPAEEIDHVFDRFYKTDRSRGLDKSGTGLGLYIAKTSLLNHGEDLTVESSFGEYTEFCFTLPAVSDKKNQHFLKGD